jgi:hypothetical protein
MNTREGSITCERDERRAISGIDGALTNIKANSCQAFRADIRQNHAFFITANLLLTIISLLANV